MIHRHLSLVLATALAIVLSLRTAGTASAGVPDPDRSLCVPGGGMCEPLSSFLISGSSGCRFRFRSDGSGDRLTVTVTLRDAFDVPIPACSLSAGLVATPLTDALCLCEPARAGLVTDAAGAGRFVFSRIGGRGELGVEVTTFCYGIVPFPGQRVAFTGTDLDGSCEPGSATGVVDLGLWASGLPPGYLAEADYDCSGVVDVVDLGFLAGGFGRGCGP